MNLRLENKLALVTGSTAGIGFAIAKALAAEGAQVIINGRSETRVTEAIAAIRGHIPSAKLDGLALDLSKADAATETIKRFPDVDRADEVSLSSNLWILVYRLCHLGFATVTPSE